LASITSVTATPSLFSGFNRGNKISEVQFARSDVTNRRKTAVQHVVDAFEAASFFHRDKTVRLLDDADHRMIARRRRTKPARNRLREMLQIEQRTIRSFTSLMAPINRSRSVSGARIRWNAKRWADLLTDAGQAFQFVDQFSDWFGVL
jgi:hypothetical protein